MNKKIIAAVAAAIVLAGVGYFVFANEKNSSYALIAQVNIEGSGIYIDETLMEERGGPSAFYSMVDGKVAFDESNKAAWGKLIMGTPGTTTIQHVQLQTIVEEQMGLKFRLYQYGSSLKDDTVYFVSSINNASLALNDEFIKGGILWQPQYQAIIDDADGGFAGMALTNDIFPEHPCCVLAGTYHFLESSPEVTLRFLAGYIEGVNWVNQALADPDSEDYRELVALAVDKTGKSFTEEVIEEALATITFTYGSNGDESLADLEASVVELVDNLEALEQLKRTVQGLGFEDATAFADKFVDGSYLAEALGGVDPAGPRATVRVAVISGDVHQIALHAAVHKEFFEGYNIEIKLSSATNGGGVAVAIQNGTVDFGMLGVPPATIATINSELIKA